MESTLDEQQVEDNPKREKRNSKLEKEKRKAQQEREHQEKMTRKKEKKRRNELKLAGQQAFDKANKMAQWEYIETSSTWRGCPDDPSLDSFYAAALFWEFFPPKKAWMEGANDAYNSTTITGTLLDLIARFFARAMKGENVIDRNKCPAKASDSVTATAMGKVEGKKDQLVIYIAKNGGPQDFDDKSDKDMANELELWYNRLDREALPHNPPEDPIWSKMQSFWYHRLLAYAKMVKRTWCNFLKHSRTSGLFEIETFGLSKEDLKTDRGHVEKLMAQPLFRDSSRIDDPASLIKFVKFRCTEYQEPWSPITYKKDRPRLIGHHPAEWGLAENDFRETVKYLQAMEIVTSLWKTLVSFRGRCRMDLSFQFLEVEGSEKVPKEPLRRELKDWQRKAQTEEELKLAHYKAGEYNGIQKRLHCELQLLKLPWTTDDTHVAKPEDMPANTILLYIGCNKLSCYFCWEILQSLGLTTRNTHGKIYCNWEAPWNVLSEPNRREAGDCLQRIHSQIKERLDLHMKNTSENSILRKTGVPASETPFAPKALWLRQPIVPEKKKSDDRDDEYYGYSERFAEPEEDKPTWSIFDSELQASDWNPFDFDEDEK